MLPPNNIAIYDFEGQLEAGFTALFSGENFDVISWDSDPEFQSPKPRVELMVLIDSAGHPVQLTPLLSDNTCRVNMYSARLTLRFVTNCDDSGKLSHRAYRANARSLIESCPVQPTEWPSINNNLQYHFVHFPIRPDGSSRVSKQQDGVEWSVCTYQLKFSIRPDAWPQLFIQPT